MSDELKQEVTTLEEGKDFMVYPFEGKSLQFRIPRKREWNTKVNEYFILKDIPREVIQSGKYNAIDLNYWILVQLALNLETTEAIEDFSPNDCNYVINAIAPKESDLSGGQEKNS